MCVDDVELVAALEAMKDVAELPERAADPLARRHGMHRRKLRFGVRVAGCEQRYVVPAVDEAVREQGDDPLDAAVTRRRDGEPARCKNGDPHSARDPTPFL